MARIGLLVIVFISTLISCNKASKNTQDLQEIEKPQKENTYRTKEPTENKNMKPEDTEFYEPVPKKVEAHGFSQAPSDAILLFDGKKLDHWVQTNDRNKSPEWTVKDDVFTNKPGTGNIETKQKFGNYQLHIEFKLPKQPDKNGQDKGNSGLFLASIGEGDAGYELQILNSYDNKTYTNGQAGSIYKQYPPLVNASKPAEKWQSYDVIWTAPQFEANGDLKSPAKVTAFQNGVLIQNDAVLKGVTLYIGHPYYVKHGKSPIKLQDHAQEVSFRNIWVRELE